LKQTTVSASPRDLAEKLRFPLRPLSDLGLFYLSSYTAQSVLDLVLNSISIRILQARNKSRRGWRRRAGRLRSTNGNRSWELPASRSDIRDSEWGPNHNQTQPREKERNRTRRPCLNGSKPVRFCYPYKKMSNTKYVIRHGFSFILNQHHVRSAYQPPVSSTFLSEQTSHQQPVSNTLLSEHTSTSHQPTEQAAKRVLMSRLRVRKQKKIIYTYWYTYCTVHAQVLHLHCFSKWDFDPSSCNDKTEEIPSFVLCHSQIPAKRNHHAVHKVSSGTLSSGIHWGLTASKQES
jgi:hypothetical protein